MKNLDRKVFSSGLAHLSLVFLWLSSLSFHGAYFSNYVFWVRDPENSFTCSNLVWSQFGQDTLNSAYFQGMYITSAIFNLWLSSGITSVSQLKLSAALCIIGAMLCIFGSLFHNHKLYPSLYAIFKASKPSLNLRSYSSLALIGLASISWSAHIIHVSLPLSAMLGSGLDPHALPSPMSLLFNPGLGLSLYLAGFNEPHTRALITHKTVSSPLVYAAYHHLFLGLALVIASLCLFAARLKYQSPSISLPWHLRLSANLLLLGFISIIFSQSVDGNLASLSFSYPFLLSDYPAVFSLFTHHMWVGSFLIVGSGSHFGVFVSTAPASTIALRGKNRVGADYLRILSHRDVLLGHLFWVCLFLGFHSFCLYVHNDVLQALGRPEDMFADQGLQLKPIFASWVQSLTPTLGTETCGGRVALMESKLATADFLVHHVHAFTIHVSTLVLLKAALYARSSRLVPDKTQLGFRYPCDGPGRGGTCQISPFDHVFLALFWMYNTISVVIFHFLWKLESDVWGSVLQTTNTCSDAGVHVEHLSGGDFELNSTSINGWLRNLLWSQSSQVIQSYGTPLAGYTLIFLFAHFVWAFSLMFNYSGRGYWQELIESIVWAGTKSKLVVYIQPRALSISHGRAVGVTHYICGGIGCTWAFGIARLIALSQ